MKIFTKRVLVVDDESAVRNLLLRIIKKIGYDVIAVSDGTERLYLFVTNFIDLVVTDFDMPRMNGWSLSHHVKLRSSGIPVVLVISVVRSISTI
ncbi:MAG: response regulator [Pseudomonadota bacterium]